MHLQYFKEKILPLRNKLYRQAILMLGDRDEAEDIVQEAFLRLWNAREKWASYQKIESLCFRSVKNLCIDRLRSRSWHAESIDRQAGQLTDILTPLDYTANKQQQQIIIKIILTCSLREREIFQLRNLEGYSLQEIATITGIRENTVAVILSRTRKKIRSEYLKLTSHEGR